VHVSLGPLRRHWLEFSNCGSEWLALIHDSELQNHERDLRRESAERPKDDSLRPSAQSDRDTANRCVVVQDVASGGASIAGTDRDSTGRPWPTEPAPSRLATAATSVARSATADGQMGESAGSNAPGRPTGRGGQASRAAGLDASTTRIGSRRPFGRHDASRVAWPATMATSMVFAPDAILARQS
jgi:hypothetical protein